MPQRVPFLFRGKAGVLFFALVIGNIFLFAFYQRTVGRASDYKNAFGISLGLPLALGMIGWWLGSGIAIFVQRNVPYSERRDAVSGVVIIVLQALFTVFCLFCFAVAG
jgi:hypothetical protein